MSHVVLWEFFVRTGREREFEEAYGPHGTWAALFARDREYLGTDLVRLEPRHYLTMDRWTSAEALSAFHAAHAEEYRALDARCEAFTEREGCVGAGSSLGSVVPEHAALDSRVHAELLQGIARNGFAQTSEELGATLGARPEEVGASLRRLHDHHGLVLHPGTLAVWIAHPFSLSPTAVSVAANGHVYWAPCLWCAMGMVELVGSSADIHVRLGGETEEITIRVRDGELLDDAPVVHFAMPPRDAWNNVVHFCASVLPFRHAADVDAWCARHRFPRGAVVPLARVRELGRAWYGRHLAHDWVKWTTDEAQAIFESVGLTGEFWSLSALGTGRF